MDVVEEAIISLKLAIKKLECVQIKKINKDFVEIYLDQAVDFIDDSTQYIKIKTDEIEKKGKRKC